VRRRLLTRDQRSCSEFVIAKNFSKASESDVWNRRCRIPATARPRADLLRTKLDRSAKRRDQLDDVRSGKVSARSARTRIFGPARGGPVTRIHGFKKRLVRKWQLAKYRGVSVNHLTSPPLSRLLAPSVLSSILPSAASGCPDYTAVLVHAYNFARSSPVAPHAGRPLARSLLLSPARRASLERFGRSSPLPVLLKVSVRQSPEKRRLRAHRRRSARSPRVLYRAGSEIVGAASNQSIQHGAQTAMRLIRILPQRRRRAARGSNAVVCRANLTL
jgi:hypothetical protein